MDLAKLHLHWRVGKNGKKSYKSFSLARAYRKDGKNRKEIALKLGKLSDDEVAQWRVALRAARNPDALLSVESTQVVITSHRAFLDVATILETWNSWELSAVFDSLQDQPERSVPLSAIAALLTINRCVDPSTKSRVPAWVKKTALPLLLDIPEPEINPSRIFRELSSIEACKDRIAAHLCKIMSQKYPEAMQSLFYDLSSTTFTGSRCLLVNWGHCKEGYDNHVVLALIVNSKGLPVYWETLEGNTADAKTIGWLLERVQTKLPIATPTMVFDRGMVSEENLTLLEDHSVKYITAMDKNQIETIAKMQFAPFAKMAPEDVETLIVEQPDFIRLDDVTHCKEVGVHSSRRYVLCFNVQLFKDQRKAREDQLTALASFVNEQNLELLQAKRDRDIGSTKTKFDNWLRKAKLQSFVTVELKEESVMTATQSGAAVVKSYQGRVRIDKKQKLHAGRLDGFWLLVTNLSEKVGDRFIQNTQTVVQPYRDKVVIESSFRDIKSFIEVGPVHVWKEDHVKAHYTICVLSHLINRTLSLQLHERKKDASEEVISHERLYEELSECRLNHIKTGLKQALYSLTEPTLKLKELLERLKMKYLTRDAMLKIVSDRALATRYV